MMNQKILFAAVGVLALGLTGCNDDPPPSHGLDKMRQKAASTAESSVTTSYEIKNIERRRLLFGKPGVIGYVVFLNDMGQPVQYLTVNGKCTSSNKRLTPGEEVESGRWEHEFVMKAPSEDGTYGESDNYVYCFMPDGRYVQWNGNYLYSDKPLELTIKPMIVSVSNDKNAVQGQ